MLILSGLFSFKAIYFTPFLCFSEFNCTFLSHNFITLCFSFHIVSCLSVYLILFPSLFGAARSLHAGWDVWQLPPSGPWGPRAPLHSHQPLQHSQADHHPVSITMDDHHVWGEGHPAGDGDCPETGLTNLGSGVGLTCCSKKINNRVVPFKQTSESQGFLWVKNPLFLPEVLCCLVDVVFWSADVYYGRKSVEILSMFSAEQALQWGGFMVCLNSIRYYLFTLENRVAIV